METNLKDPVGRIFWKYLPIYPTAVAPSLLVYVLSVNDAGFVEMTATTIICVTLLFSLFKSYRVSEATEKLWHKFDNDKKFTKVDLNKRLDKLEEDEGINNFLCFRIFMPGYLLLLAAIFHLLCIYFPNCLC